MRLINIFLAAMAVAVVAIGCTKDEVFDTPKVSDYAVEFNVADKGGFDATTRAVKTTWAAGDQIAIFCRPTASGEYVSDNAKIIYLKYDGSAWSASPVSAALVAEMESSGEFRAIHHRVGSDENITVDNSGTFKTYNGGELLYYAGNYTKADGVISLGSITMSLFPNNSYAAGRLFQVSVPGLNAADGWTMAIANDNYTPSESNVTALNQLAHYATFSGLFRFDAENGMIGTWGKDYAWYSECACVQNGDDISFVFERRADLENVDANKRYHFYLTNGTAAYTYTIDRGAYDGAKYEKNLEIGHAYLLPAISKWTNPNAPANDEIWYTNGSTTEPTAPKTPSAFGDATIQSNSYNAEKKCWVIKFDKDLTEIGEYAFGWCYSLTSVTIPDSVTTIGQNAFFVCESLTSVTIPDSVTSIGELAFATCSSLTSVTIGDSVTEIGMGAFYHCTSLTEFTGKFAEDNGRILVVDGVLIAFAPAGITEYNIPDSVTTIGGFAFGWCYSLTSVTIGDSVTTIGQYAFYDCDSLTSVNIPDSVTIIGFSAFENCDSLTSVTIPDSVTTIGERAFYYCTSLTSVTIGNSVTTIGNYAFYECYNLTSVTIGDSVTTIGEGAFSYCSSLTSVTIPNSVTEIGQYAFYDCTSLISVTIPDSVTEIGEYAFCGCTNLISVNIPDSVTTIGYGAFGWCDSLTSVTIGDGVTMIGDAAFYSCTSLTSVYCKATTPPALGGTYVFDDNGSGRKIYVPTESVSAYKSAYGWSEYASAIVGYDFENGESEKDYDYAYLDMTDMLDWQEGIITKDDLFMLVREDVSAEEVIVYVNMKNSNDNGLAMYFDMDMRLKTFVTEQFVGNVYWTGGQKINLQIIRESGDSTYFFDIYFPYTLDEGTRVMPLLSACARTLMSILTIEDVKSLTRNLSSGNLNEAGWDLAQILSGGVVKKAKLGVQLGTELTTEALDTLRKKLTEEPSITITDLVVVATESTDDETWDFKIKYGINVRVKGGLLMNGVYPVYEGNWTTPGRGDALTLAQWNCSTQRSVKYSSKNNPHTSYIYFMAETYDGVIIQSTNYLVFDFNGSMCNISLSDNPNIAHLVVCNKSSSHDMALIPAKLSQIEQLYYN